MHHESDAGEKSERAISESGERECRDATDDAGRHAGLDRIGAERRTDGALLDNGELGRQRSGPELDRQVVRALNRERPRDLSRSAKYGLADDRCGEHLVVQHDREWPADVFACEFAEDPGARLVETERDDRLVRALVETRLGVDQLVTAQDRCLPQQVRKTIALCRRIDPVAGRRQRRFRVFGGYRRMHLMEAELCGFANQVLKLLRVLQARKLNQNAITALPHDAGLGRTQAVYAAPDRLYRGADRIRDALLQPGLGRLDQDEPVLRLLDVDIVTDCPKQRAAKLLDHAAQLLDRGIRLFRLGDTHLNGIALNAEAGKPDFGIAETFACIVPQGL